MTIGTGKYIYIYNNYFMFVYIYIWYLFIFFFIIEIISFRVSALNIINENMVTVYFCDFGDVSILSLDKLQPLKGQFLELPYQAIKAKLVGEQLIHR